MGVIAEAAYPPKTSFIHVLVTLEVSPGAEKWFNTRFRQEAGSRTISFVLTSRQQECPVLCPTMLRQGAKAFGSSF